MTALAARIETHRGWALAVLIAAALLIYLPGFFTLPATDRDESRFAEASRQMLETGNIVDIRFQDDPRYQKPIGIYWLQAASALIVDRPANAIWPYRLPSLLAALVALEYLFRLGERLFDRRCGFVAALLLGASILLGVEARLATTDACLLAATLASYDALAAMYLGRGKRQLAIQFWVALGIGILIKGPMLPLIVLLTIATLAIADRRVAWLRALEPLWGIPLMAIIVAPWLIAIGLASHGAFYKASLGKDFFAKIMGGQELHGFPPGFYLLAFVATFWPGGLLAAAAAPTVWLRRRLPSYRFLLAWLLPAWVALELVPTKLVHYVLPLYPALALLAAAVFLDRTVAIAAGWPRPAVRAGIWIWLGIGIGVSLAVVFGGWWLTGYVDILIALATLFAATAMLLAIRLLAFDRRGAALGMMLLADLIVQTTVLGAGLPQLDQLWLSRQAARLIATTSHCGHPVVAAVGYHEPSLVFMLGRNTRLVDAKAAARYLKDQQGKACVLALIPAQDDEAFRTALADATPQALGQVEEIDYTHRASPAIDPLCASLAPA